MKMIKWKMSHNPSTEAFGKMRMCNSWCDNEGNKRWGEIVLGCLVGTSRVSYYDGVQLYQNNLKLMLHLLLGLRMLRWNDAKSCNNDDGTEL